MVFAKYKYKNYHNGNKADHPSEWATMLKSDYDFCHKMTFFKWVLFYFYLFIGRFEICELPSHHRYWRLQVIKDRKRNYQRIKSNLKKCLKDHRLIPVLFRKDKDIHFIKKDLSDAKSDIRKLKK